MGAIKEVKLVLFIKCQQHKADRLLIDGKSIPVIFWGDCVSSMMLALLQTGDAT